MFTTDLELEDNEIRGKCELPTLMHINGVIGESQAGSDDAAREYLKEIYLGTFYRAITEILNSNENKIERLIELQNYANDYFAFLDKLHIRYEKEDSESLLTRIQSVIKMYKNGEVDERLPLKKYYRISLIIDNCKHAPVDTISQSISQITPSDFKTAMTEILESDEYHYPLLTQLLKYAKRYYAICDKFGIAYGNQAKESLISLIDANISQLKKMETR